MIETLKSKVRELPDSPGVYLLKDRVGRVLYIGKAKSLKKRVSSYLRSDQDSPKITAMIKKIRDVDYLGTESEVEALLAERRLVKDIKPKYNTELKDDKSFPCLKITTEDDFPAVRFWRGRGRPKELYYGPFTDVRALRALIKMLQKIFRFRTCKLTIDKSDRRRRYARPCLLYHIDCCTAPCADLVTYRNYRKDIDDLIDFLNGEKEKALTDLRKRMDAAASRLDYEQAAKYRNQIRALETLDSLIDIEDDEGPGLGPISPEAGVEELKKKLGLEKLPRIIEGVDISTISGKEAAGSKVIFVDGIPFKNGYRRYKIKAKGRDDYKMIGEVVRRRFSRALREGEDLPDLLLVDGGAGHVSEAAGVLEKLGLSVQCLGLAKKNEEIFLPDRKRPLRLPSNDPALRMLQCVRDEAHRFAHHYHSLLRKRKLSVRK